MSNPQMDLIEELDSGISDLASNLIAIARGANTENVLEQFSTLASALNEYRNVEGCDPPIDQIFARLRTLEFDGQKE
jgi:hypothetical protein